MVKASGPESEGVKWLRANLPQYREVIQAVLDRLTHCLRCKTIALTELGPADLEIRVFECPSCQRHYALRPGKQLTFRWLHPISLPLYAVIFYPAPVSRAVSVATMFVRQMPPDQLQQMIDEIRLELADPTQQIQDILDCRASEQELRDYLRVFADNLERLLSERRSGSLR
jgi:hypothetical protein